MPRAITTVKNYLVSPGLVDLHFHGAFGIDLMSATSQQLDLLSKRLWENGIAAFCPTTLSTSPVELAQTVSRLGRWIRENSAPGAVPLGIHLEGPFIHPGACGAHPLGTLRKPSKTELEQLWKKSQGTLKILTLAPEILNLNELKWIATWAKERKIILSLGHSKATEAQALQAFEAGFSGVTHAWNALPYHHRQPGVLGAALGRKNLHIELIIDQIHVAPAFIRWTLDLHHRGVCFVSDCVPAAATTDGKWYPFGGIRARFKDGACRLPGGHLAGGGHLLGESYSRWLNVEATRSNTSLQILLKQTLPCLTRFPLQALGLNAKVIAGRRIQWRIQSGGRLKLFPIK